MQVRNSQTGEIVELSLVVDGEEIIGELIDWNEFYYSEITNRWYANRDTIRQVQQLLKLRE